MLIKELRLTSFKLFKRKKFRLAPLTIVTGANSSGKSAILNAIAAVLQTKTPHMFPLELVANGRYCNLGGYRDIVRDRRTRNPFGLGLTISRDDGDARVDVLYRYQTDGLTLPQRVTYRSAESQLRIQWKRDTRAYSVRATSSVIADMVKGDFYSAVSRFVVAAQRAQSRSEAGSSAKIKPPSREEFGQAVAQYVEAAKKSFQVNAGTPLELADQLNKQPIAQIALQELSRTIRTLQDHGSYIGPVRAYPSRYYFSEDVAGIVDARGRNAISVLYDWKRHSPKLFNEVVALLGALDLGSSVDAQSTLDEILRLTVQPTPHSQAFSIADVGFGISQVLPVLIADVSLGDQGLLVVNQPEVHLHPSSQASLANYMVDRLQKRQYVVETHSEYLINRVRLLLARGALREDQVSLIFIDQVRQKGASPTVFEIQLLADGSMPNAPPAFFDTYFVDSLALATELPAPARHAQ